MATLTTGIVMMRWQIISAVMMFLASTLNIQFRKSDYAVLAVISSGIGIATWTHFKDVMWDVLSKTPPEWPLILT